jgi:hypothetical protein
MPHAIARTAAIAKRDAAIVKRDAAIAKRHRLAPMRGAC